MRLAAPLVADPRAPLARANPAGKLAAATIVIGALFVSADPVTPSIIVGALVGAVPLAGLRPASLLSRGWLLLVAAASVTLVNFLFADRPPDVAPADALLTAAALGLRVGGIGLVGILFAATVDPADLAGSLSQQLRVPHRFAVGALAGLRMAPILAREWQTMGLARRARGVEAGRSPLAAVRLFGGRLLALLVAAVRRGSRMAVAMEARGFGARACRTYARRQAMRASDWALLLAAAALAAGAIGASLALGTWRPILG